MTSRSFLKSLILGALSLGLSTLFTTKAEAASYPCKILPLGDSITYGYNSSAAETAAGYLGGYRAHLVWSFAQTPSASVGTVLMVGKFTTNSNAVLSAWGQDHHSGIPGYTSAQLAWEVAYDGLANQSPDVILLHSGTNDILNSPSPQYAYALTNLNGLLDQLYYTNPSATVLLAKIIPLAGSYAYLNPQVVAYNAGLDSIAAARRALGFDVRTVDQYTSFPTSTLLDGIHPNWAGYQQMATRWRAALDATGC